MTPAEWLIDRGKKISAPTHTDNDRPQGDNPSTLTVITLPILRGYWTQTQLLQALVEGFTAIRRIDLKNFRMSDTEEKIRYAIGSAAAATAIFVPLSYKWKTVLTGIAAGSILTGVYGVSPLRRLLQG